MGQVITADLRHRSCVLSIGLLLLGSLSGPLLHTVQAEKPEGFDFIQLATIPGPAPGGGSFASGFRPGNVNNRGEVVFGAGIEAAGEGIFTTRNGESKQLVRSGQSAPGGGIFGMGVQGNVASNEHGDVAFSFYLEPFTYPIGANVGTYRFSRETGALTPVVVPGVTPAPGGGVFHGVGGFGLSLNNRGDIAFAGMISTDKGIHVSGEPYLGLGMGIFRADDHNRITGLVSPGDRAPGGGAFDFLRTPWINDAGDVAFVGHVAGDTCGTFGVPQSVFIYCPENVYIRKAATGEIKLIARLGDPAPGGGVFHNFFAPIVNNRGDISFMQSEMTPDGYVVSVGVYLHSAGRTIAIARPGDPMPGGGHLVTAGPLILTYHLNERDQISFDATLDTDDNADGFTDTSLYVWSNGSLRLVARTGTVVAGVGTIAHLMPPSWVSPPIIPFSGAKNNDRGELFFQATLTDGRGVLLLASPE